MHTAATIKQAALGLKAAPQKFRRASTSEDNKHRMPQVSEMLEAECNYIKDFGGSMNTG